MNFTDLTRRLVAFVIALHTGALRSKLAERERETEALASDANYARILANAAAGRYKEFRDETVAMRKQIKDELKTLGAE